MIVDGNHIIADEGKVLRRIADKLDVGSDYWLGYTYYINGEKLPEPRLEVPEDFEELLIEDIRRENLALYPKYVEKYVRERYSVSDELALQRQRDSKPDAFQEYFDYCEDCKRRAKEELGL